MSASPPNRDRVEATPAVSVVIPCHDHARFLGEAIESVRAQTWRDFEIVVVDDGSSDDPAAVCARHPGVRLLAQPQRGASAARNLGLARSHGRYLVFLDADDRLLPNALEAGARRLDAHPDWGMVSGRCVVVSPDGRDEQEAAPAGADGDPYADLLRENYIWTPAVAMFRRSSLVEAGGWDTELGLRNGEDYELSLRMAARFAAGRHDELVAEYHVHGANKSNDPVRMLRAHATIFRAQRARVAGRRRREQALRAGASSVVRYYSGFLAEAVEDDLRARRWRRALAGLRTLLRHDPARFARFAAAGLGRLGRQLSLAAGDARDGRGRRP